MHIKQLSLFPERYPTAEHYPFSLELMRITEKLEFTTPVTFFVGENGTGKSTLLEAMVRNSRIHIWDGLERGRVTHNPYEDKLHHFIRLEWTDGIKHGAFFSAEKFRVLEQNVEEWASMDPGLLDYYGGKSLMEQSHGQGHMAYFRNRFKIEGIYFMDEPENALSPRRQLELVELLAELGRQGHAQFIIATHSPILLALPGARIFSFDRAPVAAVEYEETDHYRLYRDFLNDRGAFLKRVTDQSV